jgi:DNA repair exonuclease SbcCD ATPase subunit
MTEPIKLPPLPLEDALKRAYYYTEAGEWRYPETCNEWDRWHAVAKVATLAVEQATADLRAELARVTESARTTIKQMRDEGMRAEAECDKLRAEVDALKRRLGQHDSCNGVMSESGYVPECAHLRAEVERLRAELARLTTLRPASEWDGETYVLWWREWDEAGWVIDSVSDSQQSDYWTPAFDAKGSA